MKKKMRGAAPSVTASKHITVEQCEAEKQPGVSLA